MLRSELESYVRDTYGYTLGVAAENITFVLVYGVAMRVISLGLLIFCDKNKKL